MVRFSPGLPIPMTVGELEAGRLARWRRSGPLCAGLVAVIGLSASLVGATAMAGADRTASARDADHRVDLARHAVTEEVQRYIDMLRLVAVSAGTQQQFTRDAYLSLTRPLLDAELPGATGIAFVVAASDDQIGATQSQWRNRGVPDLQLRPDGSGREHFFAIFHRTLDDGAQPDAGVDLAQAAEPAAALAEARRSGATTLSRPYTLLRDRSLPGDKRQLSFILATPVHGPPDSRGGRPFRGWIVAGLRGQDFTGSILRDATDGLDGAALYATAAEGHPIRVAALTRQPTRHSDLRREVAIPVGQQRWTLKATVPSQSAGQVPLSVAGGGSLLTLLLAGLVLLLLTSRDRARSQVIRATQRLAADIAWRELVESELRETRDALDAQRAYLGGVLDSLDVAVIASDNEGRVTLENAYSRGLGASTTLTHPDGTPLEADELPLARTLREGSVDGIEMLYHGERPRPVVMIAHGRSLFSPDGDRIGAVVTAHDITEQREHERELAGFAAIAAHDLKSPLAVIGAYTELLADDTTGEDAELLRRIDAGVRRMRRLIDDLLAYSTAREAALESVDVDLRQVVTDVVAARTDHLRLTAGEQFPDVYVGPLPAVHADPGMLRQLVDNLIGNALKYVRPGHHARVDVTATEEPGWVRVEVADRGIGIPATERDAVFAPFHRLRTEQAYGGTGLGLAICQRIVDRHGGRIGVTTNAGGGSRFVFTLPAATVTLDQPPESASSAPSGTVSASGSASQPSGSATRPGEFVRPRG